MCAYICVCVRVCMDAYNGICSDIKKKCVLPFATTQVHLEGIMLSEISQMQDKHQMISLTCGI